MCCCSACSMCSIIYQFHLNAKANRENEFSVLPAAEQQPQPLTIHAVAVDLWTHDNTTDKILGCGLMLSTNRKHGMYY